MVSVEWLVAARSEWEGSGRAGVVGIPILGTGRGLEALPECLEELGGLESPFQRVWRGRKALTEGREGLRGHSRGMGSVGRPFWRADWVGKPSQRTYSVQEALPEGRVEPEGPPGVAGGVGRPSRRAGRSREALPMGLEGLG